MVKIKTITPMFFNPDVPVEEEIRQAILWRQVQRESEKRSSKLINEWKREMNPAIIKNEITPDMIARAKDYPVENLVDIGRSGFICCLWHDEKTASMKLTKSNRLHCYGSCGKSFDSLDVYMKLHGSTFHEAVRALQ